MNAVEEHWKQIRVNILAYQPISSSHHLFVGAAVEPKSLSTRERQGRQVNVAFRSQPRWCPDFPWGYLETAAWLQDNQASSRFKLGLATKIRTPQTFLNSKMGILKFNWLYLFECHFWPLHFNAHRWTKMMCRNRDKRLPVLFGALRGNKLMGLATDIFLHY